MMITATRSSKARMGANSCCLPRARTHHLQARVAALRVVVVVVVVVVVEDRPIIPRCVLCTCDDCRIERRFEEQQPSI